MSEATLLEKLLSELEALDAPAEIDLMLQDHPGKKIKREHLARARSAAERWLLIAWRFPWLYKNKEEQAGKVPETLEDIRKLEQNFLPAGGVEATAIPLSQEGPGVRSLDPLEAGLAKLRAIPRQELTKTNGTVNVSEVARRLGYKKAGGGNWDDFRTIAAHLQAEYDEADQLAGWDDDDDEIQTNDQQQEAA